MIYDQEMIGNSSILWSSSKPEQKTKYVYALLSEWAWENLR